MADFSHKHFILPVLLAIALAAKAQPSLRSEKIAFPVFNPFVSLQTPGHDLAKRFGDNASIGLAFYYKNQHNWLFGISGGFIFSENVRNPDQYLKNIVTSEGYLIAENGTFASVFLHERGFNSYGCVGKIFPILGPNPNSGLFIVAGGGLLQHKIRFEVTNNNAPQLMADYKKGYDRLTLGPSVKQMIGYMHFHNTRTINFMVAFECIQAWTRSQRPYDFDRMQRDTQRRFDTLWGIRLGWFFPLYKRTSREYYYF